MTIPLIVPLYAAVLAFVYVYLSLRVIRSRRDTRVAIGTGGKPALERVQRVHANFAEYVPFALIILAFLETQRWPAWIVHLLCAALLIGRALHAIGVSREPEDFRLRVSGMAMTFGVILTASAMLLANAFLRA